MRLPSPPTLLFGILVWGYTLAVTGAEDATGPGGAPPVIELPPAISQAVGKYEEAEAEAKAEYVAAEAKAKAALLKSLEAEESRATKGGKLDLALAVRALRAKHDPSVGEVTGAPRTSLRAQDLLRNLQGTWQGIEGSIRYIWTINGTSITLTRSINDNGSMTDYNRTNELSFSDGYFLFSYKGSSASFINKIQHDGEGYVLSYNSPEGILVKAVPLVRLPSPSKPAR